MEGFQTWRLGKSLLAKINPWIHYEKKQVKPKKFTWNKPKKSIVLLKVDLSSLRCPEAWFQNSNFKTHGSQLPSVSELE